MCNNTGVAPSAQAHPNPSSFLHASGTPGNSSRPNGHVGKNSFVRNDVRNRKKNPSNGQNRRIKYRRLNRRVSDAKFPVQVSEFLAGG